MDLSRTRHLRVEGVGPLQRLHRNTATTDSALTGTTTTRDTTGETIDFPGDRIRSGQYTPTGATDPRHS
ncbi:hypothetical protein SRM_02197 [Salinibacter ruber M8]|uniref:Uncharacterized protein n=1 Tax=Salinibacter ruber (strain M8) TaxID=761659 RepID=D5HAR3_SALRM|nr:hypothetical protein SRM_02197 [Salinibacter ruber M8]